MLARPAHAPPVLHLQNAYTSADETCYQLVVPVGARPGAAAGPGSSKGSPGASPVVKQEEEDQGKDQGEEEEEGAEQSGISPAVSPEQAASAAGIQEPAQEAGSTKSLTSKGQGTSEQAAGGQLEGSQGTDQEPGGGQPQDLKLLNDALGVLAQFAFKIRCVWPGVRLLDLSLREPCKAL